MQGLFNRTIDALAEMIYEETTIKQTSLLVKKALALGLPVDKNFNRERIIYIVAQSLVTLIDSIINQHKNKHLQISPTVNKDASQHQIQQKSTLNSRQKSMMGNINIAVLIYEIFCPKVNIWDIVEKMTEVKKSLLKEDSVMEIVEPHRRIHMVENYIDSYKCHCLVFKEKTKQHKIKITNCHYCLQQYHPNCQTNPMFCNSCYLRFCLMELGQEIKDPFSENKQSQSYFYGYIQTSVHSPPQDKQLSENIYFHTVRFGMNNFEQQADRKQRYIEIRISVVNKLFPDQLVLPIKSGSRTKTETNYFWIFDNTQYTFFLNFNEVRYTSSPSKNCIILKVPHRLLQANNNILVIKAVKRNELFQLKNHSVIQYCFGDSQQKILMVGVIDINRKKSRIISNQINPNNVLPPITVLQSCHYLQFIRQVINQGPYEIVNLYDQSGSKKIQVPVRSFGCQHIECFDYLQFKAFHNIPKQTSFKRYKKKISKNIKQPEQFIQLGSDSSSVVEVMDIQANINENDSDMDCQIVSSLSIPSSTTKGIYKTKSLEVSKKRKQKKQKIRPQSLLCPICKRRLFTLYQDPLFKQILLNSGFYKKVKILNNGQYTFQLSGRITPSQELIDITQ